MTDPRATINGDADGVLEPTECLRCGACCFAGDPRYVRVTGDDHERLGDLAEEYTRFIENRCYMRVEQDICAALQIDAERGEFRCRLYPLRPEICRTLQPGSPQCQAERQRKAERARRRLEACRRRRSGAES